MIEAGFARLGHFVIAHPAFVFELDALNQSRVRVGVEVRLRLEFRDPAAINFIRERELAGFVVNFDDEILAEILERNLLAEAVTPVPDFVGPFFEFGVVRDAAFEADGFVFGAAG